MSARTMSSSANVLDLISSDTPDLISDILYFPVLSGHSLLHFSFVSSACRDRKQVKQIWDYKIANYTAIDNSLCWVLDDILLNCSECSF